MNRRRRRRNSGSNLRWLTEALFQRQLRADYRASRGADYKIRGPKIDSLTSETVRQTNFSSPTYGAAATKHECPQPVTSSAVRTAVNYHFTAPTLLRRQRRSGSRRFTRRLESIGIGRCACIQRNRANPA